MYREAFRDCEGSIPEQVPIVKEMHLLPVIQDLDLALIQVIQIAVAVLWLE